MLKLSIALALAAAAAAPSVVAEMVGFDDIKPGNLPPSWIGTQTGKGEARWSIATDDSGPSKPNVLIKVIFDGKHLFDVEDSALPDAGKVGVWTKADSVTLFDDFTYGSKN